MENILFNKTAYDNISPQLKYLYKNIGGYVYALDPKVFRIDSNNLPKWLSKEQYSYNRNLVSQYYQLVTRGIGRETVILMQLIPNLSYGNRINYQNASLPKEARITEEVYWNLPSNEKIKFKKVVSEGKAYYVNTATPIKNIANIARPSVRPPTVGIKKVPSGKWVEMH